MAGPGGGPPRRSHTKSRKGCETCKRRHIRCDETFPQCRNCTKHKIRCPYNDVPILEERSATPERPDLMWTPEIEAAIEQWKHTGVFPFPSLEVYPGPSPHNLSDEELRLIYHVASISHELGLINANGITLWTEQIPTLIRIGTTHDFVLHALMAFSAMHIAFLNECPIVGNRGYEHRGAALKGLQEAIGNFSRENSDAILAASLVLSWQATDWKSWTQLMQGTSSVIEAMGIWKNESLFGDFIAERNTFPTAPPSPAPDHRPSQPRREDLDAFQRTIQQLQKVESHLKHNGEDTKMFSQLVTFVKGARKVSPSMSVTQQFDRLQPLRKWLFWLPVMYLQQTGDSPSSLVIIAHFYTVALMMERLFPEIGAAYFGSLTIRPVEAIARKLFCKNDTYREADFRTHLALLELPVNTVTQFRSRRGWTQPTRTQSFPQFDPPNFYIGENEPMQMSSATVDYMPPYVDVPFVENPAFSYSTEDLSVLSGAPGANPSVSPLQLSSPFMTSQFLNVPGSSYTAAYSPTSSTYGGDFGDASSIAFSDSEEYGSFDMSLSTSGPPFSGGLNTYGAGFVPPLQSVWI